MNGILKYRLVAFVLVMVFGVFNIGIPIIIASCSMPEMMRGGSCPMCDDQESPSTATLSTQNTTPCCTTTIIAERNTNEFVQAKGGIYTSLLPAALALGFPSVVNNLSSASAISWVSSSPPTVVDIPILTSSLLI